MILEVAILDVVPGKEMEFEAAFAKASAVISRVPGYISHQLQYSIENTSRYILLVNWNSLEDHIVGFRNSEQYQEWKKLLHHFYNPFPVVEHYSMVFERGGLQGPPLMRQAPSSPRCWVFVRNLFNRMSISWRGSLAGAAYGCTGCQARRSAAVNRSGKPGLATGALRLIGIRSRR